MHLLDWYRRSVVRELATQSIHNRRRKRDAKHLPRDLYVRTVTLSVENIFRDTQKKHIYYTLSTSN